MLAYNTEVTVTATVVRSKETKTLLKCACRPSPMQQKEKSVPSRIFLSAATLARISVLVLSVALFCAWNSAVSAQQSGQAQQQAPAAPPASQAAPQQAAADQQVPAQAPQGTPASQPAPSPAPADAQQEATPTQSAPAAQPDNAPAPSPETPHTAAPEGASQAGEAGGITEDELKKMLVGKALYLRGGYLDNTLSFNEHGALIGHSPQGSYTLCGVQIDRVHLTKHKVELEGERFGLHFLGALPYEDPSKATDRVNVTPKKKPLKVTIDRELVIKPKQKKEKGKPATAAQKPAAPPAATATPAAPATSEPAEESDAKEAEAEIAAAPAAERPADPKSVTTTTSPAHATQVLKDALDHMFAEGLDERMMAAMPDFWKLYYQAVTDKTDYRPSDPGILRQSMVDQKARLITNFEPASNQFAQDYGVAGMSLYHVVIDANGKPGEIAVARPIGFGLDESAVESIRKASFEPAIKDGKPVPVMLDLVVEFRIYSKRTAVASNDATAQKSAGPTLPGPYTVEDRHQ
jgi:outer membrane biosynthesis protein TonB